MAVNDNSVNDKKSSSKLNFLSLGSASYREIARGM
jgi:hypothetical protein